MMAKKNIIEETDVCNICGKPLLRGDDSMIEVGVPCHMSCFMKKGDKK